MAPSSLASKMGKSAKMQALIPTCTIKNRIRKIPDRLITIFLPIDDVNTCFQVIPIILVGHKCSTRHLIDKDLINPVMGIF
jgi:hypothetical protein